MLRYAKKDEAKEVINLLALAMENFVDMSNKALIEHFFTQENNRFSYQNIIIYKKENQIAGALCFYDGEKSKELDMPLNLEFKKLGKKTLIKECEDEMYIDSVVVDEKFRGQKIATKLIFFAYEKAKEKGKKLSLIVENKNEKAKKLYENLGFKFIKTKKFYGHLYEYMEKE